MQKECFICGDNAFSAIGGVLLCQAHRAAVMAEIDTLRAAGKSVDATRIAYEMREPCMSFCRRITLPGATPQE
jgi:hypothetical protein